LWLELGPFRLQPGEKVTINPYSWHKVANLLFIDQPVGTGLSYTTFRDGLAKNDRKICDHFYFFLQNFFQLHKRYQQPATINQTKMTSTRSFYLTGESHAGHYIPIMAADILQRNREIQQLQSQSSSVVVINLQGVAMGNPWMDPASQYDVSDFAHGMGLISKFQRNYLKEKEKECVQLLRKGRLNQPVCFSLLDSVIDTTSVPTAQVCIS